MRFLIYLFLCIFFCQCKGEEKTSDIITPIDLRTISEDVSFYDLFTKAEIIPLEICDSSMLATVDKYEISNDTIYILDRRQHDVFMYDLSGHFLGRLSRKGNGPGEYPAISDMTINRFTGNVEILSIAGSIMIYNRDLKTFITQIKLPTYFVHSFHHVSRDIYALFFDTVNNDALSLYSVSENKVVASGWNLPEALSFTGFVPHKPFFVYNDSLFVYKGYSGEILSVSDGNPVLQIRHGWDFGEYTFDVDAVPVGKDWRYYHELFMNGSSDCALGFIQNVETASYYISQFRYKNKDMYLFYDKQTQISQVFSTFKEGFSPRFNYVHNNSLFFVWYPEHSEKAIHPTVLDEVNLKRYYELTEESNMFFVKLHLKK